jgi:hypothetical protein
MIAAIYNCLWLPVSFGFSVEKVPFTFYIDLIADIAFFIDIVVTFCTTVDIYGEEVN